MTYAHTSAHAPTPTPACVTRQPSEVHIAWRLALLARQAAAALMLAATLGACVADDDAAMATLAGAGAATVAATIAATQPPAERIDHSVVNQPGATHYPDQPGASVAAYGN